MSGRFWIKYALFCLGIGLLIGLLGCASVNGDTYRCLGQCTVEHCTTDLEEDNAETCIKVKTKGLSGEFSGIVSALFGWVPWPF